MDAIIGARAWRWWAGLVVPGHFAVRSIKSMDVKQSAAAVLPPSAPVETSRLMVPDDSNSKGNVHGGTILKLIEQAGHIVATRHCNRNGDQDNRLITVLARVEHTDFHQPMYVGEVSQVQADVTFTSQHSMEVMVDVWAENLITGERRHTNSATLWYVATPANVDQYQRELKPATVPQLTEMSPDQYERGKKRYDAQKMARQEDKQRQAEKEEKASCKGLTSSSHQHHDSCSEEVHTMSSSRTTLANVVLPSDCYLTGHMMGGALMKMMDNAAGICAARHCRTPVVTACLEAINFNTPIINGEVVFVTAELVFTSSRSLEIEVRTEAEGGLRGGSRRVTNTAYFTFVSLGKDGRAVAVPPLKMMSEEEKERFEEGRRRYQHRKNMRSQHKN